MTHDFVSSPAPTYLQKMGLDLYEVLMLQVFYFFFSFFYSLFLPCANIISKTHFSFNILG